MLITKQPNKIIRMTMQGSLSKVVALMQTLEKKHREENQPNIIFENIPVKT